MKPFSILVGLLLISSLAVAEDPWVYRGEARWDSSWNKRPFPRTGACFFKEAGFQGDRFCVNRGDRLESLPGNFGDNISSIQLFGKARTTVFNDRSFRGGGQEFRSSIPDLRTQKFRDGHTWNDRISSLKVQ
jgi:hypothetical protein